MQVLCQTPSCKYYTILPLQETYHTSKTPLRFLREDSEKKTWLLRFYLLLSVCLSSSSPISSEIALRNLWKNFEKRLDSYPKITYTIIWEGERGTENPSQVPPCATGWPVRVVFSTTDEQQEKELRFRYSRVVRFRPRDAFFSWHLTFDLLLLLLNWLRNNPWCAYDLEMTDWQ